MKINELQVDGFGVWSGLKLEALSDRLTVFYGPNEAGKTTLMQFVRGVLYGYNEPSRRKYLPPLSGAKPGGSLRVSGGGLGEFRLSRSFNGDPRDNGTLAIVDRNGAFQPELTLRTLLGDIDEPIFNNVFAVGLRELQELATLSDTQAAAMLYSLTSGLDRVSLIEVIRELETSRNRILADDDRPCIAAQLLSQRERLKGEIEELKGATQRWDQLQGQIDQIVGQVERLEEDNKFLDRQARLLETAIALREPWHRRQSLGQLIEQMSAGPTLPEDALEQLAVFNTKIEHEQQQRRALLKQRRAIKLEVKALRIRQVVWRQVPRIEAVAEQQPWVETLEAQIKSLDAEVAELQSRRKLLRDQLGSAGGGKFVEPPQIQAKLFSQLGPAARNVRAAKDALKRVSDEIQHNRSSYQSLESRIAKGLEGREESSLAEALEVVGHRAGQLRRRVAIDERLTQMERHREDLERQSMQSLDGQLLPVEVLSAIGMVFVLGVIMLLSSLWVPNSAMSTFGTIFIGIGACVTGGSWLWKVILERAAAHSMVASSHQADLLERQVAQVVEEREALDRELPRGGGPIAARLQAAERELSELEDLLPLEAQRKAAQQEYTAAEQRVERVRDELKKALNVWREALMRNGLPSNLSPKQVKELAGQRAQTSDVHDRLHRASEELEKRRVEHRGIVERVAKLLADVEIEAANKPLVEQIRILVSAAREQEEKMNERGLLRKKWRKLKQEDLRFARTVAQLRRKRQALIEQAGVQTEEQFRKRVEEMERAQATREEFDTVCREISAALGAHTTEADIAGCLATEKEGRLEDRWEALSDRLETNHDRLKKLLEQRGELNAQLKSMAEDRRITERRMELAVVETRLKEALDDWQVRAVTGCLLETLRKEFEEHRQPETLLEASIYMSRLTAGHYVRIWTPMDDNVLYVDDAKGQRWTVDRLSCGAREQLFLSLRLALVALYARRGVQLPVVLDDVLVNFDHIRSQAAAELLFEFTRAGHQLLVFTCHEHVWKMFRKLKADARRLPSNLNPQEAIEEEDEAPPVEELVVEPSVEPIIEVSPPPPPSDYELEPVANGRPLVDPFAELAPPPEPVIVEEVLVEEEEEEEPAPPPPPVREKIREKKPPKPPRVREPRRIYGPFGWDVELEDEDESNAEAA